MNQGNVAGWPPRWRTWVMATSLGEVIGIAVAATVAGLANTLIGEPDSLFSGAAIVLAATAGGCVEGLAVGYFQYKVLVTWLPGLSARRYVGGTTILAGTFWLLGMLPSVIVSMQGPSAAISTAPSEPPLALVAILSGLGGAVGGLAFGLVQGWALRGHVPFPWRWIRPNIIGWALAVSWITVGASIVPAAMAPVALLLVGVAVGAGAGMLVGVVTGQALPSLELRLPSWNRAVVDALLSPAHRLISGAVVALRFTGRRTGAAITVPVQYALITHDRLVIYPANPEGKLWWRNFTDPTAVLLALKGQRRSGSGYLIAASAEGYASARAAYCDRWPKTVVPGNAEFVIVDLSAAPASN